MSAFPPSSLQLRAGDRAVFAGSWQDRRRMLPSQLWVVFHRRDGWTHVYRTDDRDPRLVHLVAACEGERSEALVESTRLRFGIDARLAA